MGIQNEIPQNSSKLMEKSSGDTALEGLGGEGGEAYANG